MKTPFSILATALLTAFAAVPVSAAPPVRIGPIVKPHHQQPRYVPDELLVKFHPRIPEHAKARFNRSQGAAVIGELPFGITRLRLPAGLSPETAAERYEKNPNVIYAHPNHIVHAAMTPDDPLFGAYQWHLDNPVNGGIRMKSAWDAGSAGSGVIVAVIDTGIAYENYDEDGDGSDDYLLASDFAGTAFVPGYDFVNDDAHPNDDMGHGTHVAGTVGETTNNGLGAAGIAHNAALMPVKVLDADGSGSDAELIAGIGYAIEHGADVINMSLSFGYFFLTIPGLEDAIAAAYSSGIVLVAASGNNGAATFVSYPANNPNVIAVGATDFYEDVTDYSNRGDELELTAPGGDTSQDLSAYGYDLGGVVQQTIAPGDPLSIDYYYYMGTSMATPHVAGVAALVRSVNPALSPDEVRTILHDSAEDHGAPGWDSDYGYGIVDAGNAVLLAQSGLVPNEAPTAVISGPAAATENVAVTFDAALSSDPDGDALQYSWDIDGHPYSGQNVTHTFAWGGTRNVSLTVSDGKGGVDTTSHSIVVAEVNDLPVPNSGGPYSGEATLPIAFSAADSYDYDNEDASSENDQPLTYLWDFGDGTSGSGENTSHVYADEGTYDVTLSVSDGVDTVSTTTTATVGPVSILTLLLRALSDILFAGSVTGSYADTYEEDGVSERLTERLSGAKPSNRYTYLEHQWRFHIEPADLVTLSVTAEAEDADESYDLAYSTDGTNFTEMFTITAGTTHYSYSLPSSTSGTLYLRVTDRDRTPGDRTLHTLAVDQLLIRTESSGAATTPPAAPSGLRATVSGLDVTLYWSDANSDEEGFTVERGVKVKGQIIFDATPVGETIATTLTDTVIGPGTYYYRVQAYRGTERSDYSETLSVRVK